VTYSRERKKESLTYEGGEDGIRVETMEWARKMRQYSHPEFDEATKRGTLERSILNRVFKPVLCFVFPFLRFWGPFL